MERTKVNPWSWQDHFGFSQAIDVSGSNRILYCAGQTSVDDSGRPMHAGDMRAQIGRAFDNLDAVLRSAGLSLGHVVRLRYYTTDIDALLSSYDAVTGALARAGCQPSSTLLGVTRLAFPELLIEIEATAVS